MSGERLFPAAGADVDAPAAAPADGLAPFRARLDELDEQIARLLGERFDVCRAVAAYKSEHDIPMMQPARVEHVRERYLARGEQLGLPADFTRSLFELLIGATCKLEDELMGSFAARDGGAERR
jgi:4-amino-4-deoxychorismate mutase